MWRHSGTIESGKENVMRNFTLILGLLSLTACNAPNFKAANENVTQANPQPSPSPSASPTPTGHFLYVGSYQDAMVTVFAINSDGSLNELQQEGPFEYGVSELSMDTAQANLYVLETYTFNGTDAMLDDSSISPSTGGLTVVNPDISLMSAEANGASFDGPVSSVTSGSTTYVATGTVVQEKQSGSVINSYSAGDNPVTLLVR